MTSPLLSVIIPLYNAQDTILKCIKSILANNLDIEIIIIDDCSNDESYKTVKNFAKESDKIILLKNEKNLGCGETRNKGIELAHGEYVGFVDNDDYVDFDYFSKMTDKIIKENADICVSLRITNHTEGKIKKHLLDKKTDLKEAVFVDRTAPWAKIYKKRFLKENNIKFDSTRGEDIFPAFLCAYKAKKITSIDNSNYHCTIRKGSISHKKTTLDDIEEIKIYKKIIEQVQNKEYWMKLIKRRAIISVDFLYKNTDKELKKIIRDEYKNVFKNSNFYYDYFQGKFLIRLKRLKTFYTASFLTK